jgi:hypothetical protein
MRNHFKQQNKERSMKKTLFFLFSLMLCWSTASAAERAIKRQTLSSPSPVETPYLSGKYRALVIGNNDYDDPEKLWPSLKTAVADAEAVADILKTDYGFAEIILLKNATRRDIVKAFNKLAKEAQTNDSVLIYYAGHGYLNDDTKEGFWIPVDAEGRDDSTFVRNSTIKVKLGVIADKARHVLLVSDSCFSGALLREGNRGVSLDQKNERYYQKVAKKKSVQILAAGGLEFVDDNYKGAGHSPFTYYLLQSLKDNNARYFEATDLSQETSRNVSVNTMQTPESGVLQGAGHAGGEFFFLRKKAVTAKATTVKQEQPATKSVSPSQYRADELAWKDIENSKDSEDFIFFLEEFPESPLANTARFKLKRLKRKQVKVKTEQQQLAEKVKKLKEERRRLEAEKKRLAEAKRMADKEQKKPQELAVLLQKQKSDPKKEHLVQTSSGTVIDTSTGLIWQKKPDGIERNWQNAKWYCEGLSLGGFSDWKLPGGRELREVQRNKHIFDSYKITGKWDSSYWTANSSSSVNAYLVNFDSGNSIPYAKKNELNVRCVRDW